MPNYVKIPCQKKFAYGDLSLIVQFVRQLYTYMRYSGSILVFPTNEQFLGEKRICAKKFQIDVSKSEGLVCVYTAKRTDRWT